LYSFSLHNNNCHQPGLSLIFVVSPFCLQHNYSQTGSDLIFVVSPFSPHYNCERSVLYLTIAALPLSVHNSDGHQLRLNLTFVTPFYSHSRYNYAQPGVELLSHSFQLYNTRSTTQHNWTLDQPLHTLQYVLINQ
jgi:hypothetical protein